MTSDQEIIESAKALAEVLGYAFDAPRAAGDPSRDDFLEAARVIAQREREKVLREMIGELENGEFCFDIESIVLFANRAYGINLTDLCDIDLDGDTNG